MIRRILILTVVSMMVLGVLASCGRGNDEPTAAPAPTEAPTEAAAAEDTAAEAAPAEEAEPTAEATVEEAAASEGSDAATAEAGASEPTAADAEATTEGDQAAAATEEETAAEDSTESATAEATESTVEGNGNAPAAPTEEMGTTVESAGTVTVESARAVSDVLNNNNAVFTAISPDGTMLVYGTSEGRFWNTTRQVCVFTFANADVNCYDVDPKLYMGYPLAFNWSPDSTMVAFTENPIQLGYESDIWVLDTTDGSFSDLTDDGVVGSWVAAEPGSYALDYQPMWDESSGDLYFWRSVPAADYTLSFALMKIPAGGGEAEQVQDVSDALSGMVIRWDSEAYFMDGPSSLSNDGTTVAFIAQALTDAMTDERTGVYTLDVGSGEVTQVATMTDLAAAVPPFQESPTWAQGVQWTADSTGFVVLCTSVTSQLPLVLNYYIDLASGEMTPVVDFSSYETMDDLLAAPEGSIPPRYYSPWTASISPAGDKLFMLSDLAGVAGLLSSQLPPTGEDPDVVGAAETFSTMGGTRSSTSDTGKMVIYGFLLTTVEE